MPNTRYIISVSFAFALSTWTLPSFSGDESHTVQLVHGTPKIVGHWSITPLFIKGRYLMCEGRSDSVNDTFPLVDASIINTRIVNLQFSPAFLDRAVASHAIEVVVHAGGKTSNNILRPVHSESESSYSMILFDQTIYEAIEKGSLSLETNVKKFDVDVSVVNKIFSALEACAAENAKSNK